MCWVGNGGYTTPMLSMLPEFGASFFRGDNIFCDVGVGLGPRVVDLDMLVLVRGNGRGGVCAVAVLCHRRLHGRRSSFATCRGSPIGCEAQ
jgi:hypothetical protein